MKFYENHSSKILIAGLMTFGIYAAQPCCAQDSLHRCSQKAASKACPVHAVKAGDKKPDLTKKSAPAPEKEILFFLNPNGHPCQMQLSILNGMNDKLATLATVKYVKTTEPGDKGLFNQYGIRGLPSLIILDKSGKEIKRFTPGIQDEKAIMAALADSTK